MSGRLHAFGWWVMLGLFVAISADAAPPAPSGFDGWSGVITVHEVDTFVVHKSDETGTWNGLHTESHDSHVYLMPGGHFTADSKFTEAEWQQRNLRTWSVDTSEVNFGFGTSTPDTDEPHISLSVNDHFLINIQHLGFEVQGRSKGAKVTHGKRTEIVRWNEPKNFAPRLVDAEDMNSKPGDRQLNGQRTFNEPGNDEGGMKTVTTVTWHLTYKEDLRLLVSIDQYDTWQPLGTTSETTRGNTLHVHAKLQKKDGTPSPEKADSFLFELIDTSAVPGTAINFPKPAPGSSAKKDLQFVADDDNAALDMQGSESQAAQTKTGKITEADATVSCFDWGAYGKVRVTAVVGNRRIHGYLESDPGTTDIRIPKRSEKSFIADAWKKANHIADGVADDADADDSPKSNILDGDGLTLYEEYRGFYEHGQHKQGDPKTKDVFVRDKSNGKCLDGFKLAEKITGLAVHHDLTAEELPADRIINFNNEPATHAVDQHGTLFTANEAYGDSEVAGHGHIRCPAEIIRDVEMFAVNPIHGQADAIKEFSVAVAHELLHGLGVDHHGDGDPGVVEWRKVNQSYYEYAFSEVAGPDGTLRPYFDAGVPITICDDHGNPMTEAQIVDKFIRGFPAKINVARESGGEHSGDVICVMRYNSCNAYARGNKRILLAHDEDFGLGICTDNKGTRFNSSDAPQGSRHGNAVRGNCKAQIVVNDKRAQQ